MLLMVRFMRTTIDIDDELLQAVQARGTPDTLKTMIEQALRAFLAAQRPPTVQEPPPIPVFRGRGVQPGVDLTNNAALETLMHAKP